MYPGGHRHVYEPALFTQRRSKPQILGLTSHSCTSWLQYVPTHPALHTHPVAASQEVEPSPQSQVLTQLGPHF